MFSKHLRSGFRAFDRARCTVAPGTIDLSFSLAANTANRAFASLWISLPRVKMLLCLGCGRFLPKGGSPTNP